MRKAKIDTRPKLTVTGVAAVIGISTSTLYRRIVAGTLSLEGIPVTMRPNKPHMMKLYDMEAVFKQTYPGVSRDGLAVLMYAFREEHNGQMIR